MSSNTNPTSPLIVNLHALNLAFASPDDLLRERFLLIYGHLPRRNGEQADIYIHWQFTSEVVAPLPHPDLPVILEDQLVSYYGDDSQLYIRLPKYGLISVDLEKGYLTGVVTSNCLTTYGVFEDVMMISLAPLYRRRKWFPLHAFAALAPNGQAALITGDMGSGKTTTGLALLTAGWKLLSNDSPLLRIMEDVVEVLAYPGQLSAFDDSLARFTHLQKFIPAKIDETKDALEKRVFRAEDAFVDPWATSGVVGGIFFPKVVAGLKHSELVEISAKAAILHLMPQGVEGWDKETIQHSLNMLGTLANQSPCYVLRLSPQVEQLPQLIHAGMI